jgi:indole-3-glycerol phosphate synthase
VILDDIIETKRYEVAARKERRPRAELERALAALPPTRDFKAALTAGGAIIAEVKRRSPSCGLLRADFDPVRIAREYEEHGAAAVSVLTDETYFGGSDADLTAVKESIRLPVLRKEFIIDPYQILEARVIGADAILTCRELAALLGMASLVEVHDREELDMALSAGTEIVGINNRNLRTFKTDIQTSLELAPLIPADRIVVSESGIRTRTEIETLAKAGVRAFLIGETLVTAPEIGTKLEELSGR